MVTPSASPGGRRILISGATGLIGSALRAHLTERGHNVHTLVRTAPRQPTEHRWDPVSGVIHSGIVEHTDIVVNLSGASIGRIPWTPKYKKEILASRLNATHTLVEAIRSASAPPSALIQASAVGFYGDQGEADITENSGPGGGFLAEVTKRWEAEAMSLDREVTRVVFARTGLVVARSGAMAPLKLQTLVGLAGRIGSGNQWWPWISLRDEVHALTHLIEDPLASGPFNLVGPTVARSVEVTKTLATLLRRPHFLGLPRFAVSILMGEAGRELLLTSQKISPSRLLEAGFSFTDHTVEDALRQIV